MKLKDIKGFEGLYAITEDGRVWSYLSNKWLKPGINSSGYYYVHLRKDGQTHGFFIHRLVYSTFKGEIPSNMQVDHINNLKGDNRLENLQVLSPIENSRKSNLGNKYSLGVKHTEETRRKMSEAHKGKPKSLEWRKKISESNKRTKALMKLNA